MAEKKDPVMDASKKGGRIDQLESLIAGATKKYGQRVLVGADEMSVKIVPRVSTGLYGLDAKTNGGFPLGRVMMLYGEARSAKTTTYLRGLGNAQKLCANCFKEGTFKDGVIELPDLMEGGKRKKIETQVIVDCPCGNPKDFLTLWIDAEGVWLTDWAERMGVLPEKVMLMRPSYGEQAFDIAVAMMNRGIVDLVVIDSLAAMSPAAEVKTSMEQSHQGVSARMNNKFLRKLVAGMNNCFQKNDKAPTLWLVNQYREKIGVMFGSPNVVTGGKGQRFATTLEIECRPGKIDVDSETGEVYSAEFKYNIKKNKVGTDGQKGVFKMCTVETDVFDVGDLMEHEEVIKAAVNLGFIEKPNQTMYEFGGESFRGMSSMVRHLGENKEEYEELKSQMLEVKLGIKGEGDEK